MKITTESGSVYEINDHGIMTKYNAEGRGIDSWKIYQMKAVSADVKDMKEVWELPQSEPEIGKLLYVGGKDGWWLSTPVVRIDH
jgi:hypothetical protein